MSYIASNISTQLHDILIGPNVLIIRFAYAHGDKLQPPEYFDNLADGRKRIYELVADMKVKELWIGCITIFAATIKFLVKEYIPPRVFGQIVHSGMNGDVHTITFK